MRIARMLSNRNLLLILAVVLGLLVGEHGAREMQPAILPLLALAMTLSTTNISSRDFLSMKNVLQYIGTSLALNYVLLGASMLLLAWWLVEDTEIRTGFVLLAATPPAVAIAPFSHSLGGNMRFAVTGMIGCYIAAIGIIPAAMLIFLGMEYFEPFRLLMILAELVVLPLVTSRILLFTGAETYIRPWRGIVLNWSFFFIIFILIGLNRQAFFEEFDVLLRICAIGFTTTFVMAFLIELVSRAAGVKQETAVSAVLMGTLKNYSLAGGILLSLFNERSAIPPSVCVVFGVLVVVLLGIRFKKQEY